MNTFLQIKRKKVIYLQILFYTKNFLKVNLIFLRSLSILAELRNTGARESWHELNAAPQGKSQVIFLFCVIQAVSAGRLFSLPKSGY